MGFKQFSELIIRSNDLFGPRELLSSEKSLGCSQKGTHFIKHKFWKLATELKLWKTALFHTELLKFHRILFYFNIKFDFTSIHLKFDLTLEIGLNFNFILISFHLREFTSIWSI